MKMTNTEGANAEGVVIVLNEDYKQGVKGRAMLSMEICMLDGDAGGYVDCCI